MHKMQTITVYDKGNKSDFQANKGCIYIFNEEKINSLTANPLPVI